MNPDNLNSVHLRTPGPIVIRITDHNHCYYCNQALSETDNFCPACGFPQKGDEKEQIIFISDKRILFNELEEHYEKVQNARKALIWVAAILLLNYVISYYRLSEALVLLEGAIVVGAFVGLYFWARKNAYPAVLTGLILYTTLIVAYAIVAPLSLFGGFIWKVIAYSALIYGLRSAKAARDLYESLKTSNVDLSSHQH
ncbi:MAG: zinc ribbon domain-containing protein [Bacteroidia bacterium]|jgi:hypothetical protein|nr:zinc ribbon domain-containing protein [Bacteroidia bacterium]